MGRSLQKLDLYAYVQGNPLSYTDLSGLIRWGGVGSSALGLLGNGAGIVVGGALLGAPEPTMATKVVGGVVMVKSVTGWGLNWYNLTLAFTEDDNSYDAPSSAARLAANAINACNQNYLVAADAVDLGVDLLSGKIAIGSVSVVGSALNRAVDFSELNKYRRGNFGQPSINKAVDTLLVMQAGQAVYNGYSNNRGCGCAQ